VEGEKFLLNVNDYHPVFFGNLKYSDNTCVSVTGEESVTCRETLTVSLLFSSSTCVYVEREEIEEDRERERGRERG
jgi:hypothetical protein